MNKIDRNTLKLDENEIFVFGISVNIDELYKTLMVSGSGSYEFQLNEKFNVPKDKYDEIVKLSNGIIDILRDVHIKGIVERFREDGYTDEEIRQHIKWED